MGHRRSIFVVALTACATLAGPAQAGHRHHKHKHRGTRAQSASATDVRSGAFSATFTARRPRGAPATAATGTFHATTGAPGAEAMSIAGRVTCLEVRGDRVGLFYPIDNSTLAGLDLSGKQPGGILFTMETDGAGHARAVSFLVLPQKTVTSCAPGAGGLPASGRATTKG